MRLALVALATTAAATAPAVAQTVTLKPLAEARLRAEHVEQDGLADDSDAVTLRARVGVEARLGEWSALVEGQGTLALADDYYDGLHGAATRPVIADPQNVALHRAQLQYRGKALTVTAGRQRISLDDDRFVDAALFRQNAQTYDAVRVEWTGAPKLRADLTYAWSVRTVWGIDGADRSGGPRQRAISGDNVFAELGYATPVGTLTGYAYLAGQDEAAVQGYRLASQTYGARLAGSRQFGAVKLGYKASYARQQDWGRNPDRYDAGFYLLDASADIAAFRVGAGYEVAGADDGRPFTSFQFPVGSGIRYRGWAGKFVPTPPDGVRDLYGTLGYNLKQLGPLQAVTLQATYHRFTSDRLVRHYGNELDLLASAKIGRYAVAARFAGYDPDRFATRTRKFWLQLDWAF